MWEKAKSFPKTMKLVGKEDSINYHISCIFACFSTSKSSFSRSLSIKKMIWMPTSSDTKLSSNNHIHQKRIECKKVGNS
jgi:hypothetical protein